jgi:ABC-type Fe3+/spermidine/putrescine transport system ATPase subunit
MIAGFFDPDEGEIVIGGESMRNRPPHLRNLGMVFQNFALFPHMTVFNNVAFGLQMQSLPHEDIAARVRETLAMVRLAGYEDRYPKQLSGGQMQRVALARAVVVRPVALLLDEPFSSLDASLREQMRTEVREIQRQLGITTIFVTHDQGEALEMSDRIVVMNQGRVEQTGSPTEIYEKSTNAFVAGFVGRTNILRGKVAVTDGELATVKCGPIDVRVPRALLGGRSGEVVLTVRPERVLVRPAPQVANRLGGTLVRRTYLGSLTQCVVSVGAIELLLQWQNAGVDVRVEPGQPIEIGWEPSDCRIVND